MPRNPAISRWGARILGGALILGACAWIYWPTLRGGWIWDDAEEVTANPLLRDGRGLWQLWFSPPGPDYFPLKSTVQWLEWHAWAANPSGYHGVSLALHAVSALILWRLFARLGIGFAWLGALLFAVHPVTVESVAWIAELKNTLSLPLLLGAFVFAVDFERDGRPRHQVLSVLCFGASLLAKSSGVMLPTVLLLYAWWRRGRVGRTDLARAAPFFVLSAVLGSVTFFFQKHGAIVGQDLGIGRPWERLALAGRGLLFYFAKVFVPVDLMRIYPRWSVGSSQGPGWAAWLVLAAAVLALVRVHAGWARGAIFGLGSMALMLIPILGVVPMAYSRLSWVADHLAYVAVPAGAGLIAAAASLLRPKFTGTGAGLVCAGLAAVFAAESRSQARTYSSDAVFWREAAQRNPGAWIAHNNLGLSLVAGGRDPEAIEQFEQALRSKPDYDDAQVNLGNALARAGRPAEAEAHYHAALQARPDNTDALSDLANLELAQGEFLAAEAHYNAVVAIRPADPEALRGCAEAHYRDANRLGNDGRFSDAALQYAQALALWPSFPQAHANLGLALLSAGDPAAAEKQLAAALSERPDYAEAHAYLGLAYAQEGRLPEAVSEYREAIRLRPGAAQAHYQLGLALRELGRSDEAQEEMAEAARLGAGR